VIEFLFFYSLLLQFIIFFITIKNKLFKNLLLNTIYFIYYLFIIYYLLFILLFAI